MKKVSFIIATMMTVFSVSPILKVSASAPLPLSSFTYSNSNELVKALEQDFDKSFFDEYSSYYSETQVKNVSDYLTKIREKGLYTICFDGQKADQPVQLFLNDWYGEPNLYFTGDKSETGIQYVQLFYPDSISGKSTIEILDAINPNGVGSQNFYPAYTMIEEQLISIENQEIDCVVGKFEEDTRDYITFIYEGAIIRVVGDREIMESTDSLNTIRIESLICNIDPDFMTKELGEVIDPSEENPKEVTANYDLSFSSTKEMEEYFNNVVSGETAVPFREDCSEEDFDNFIEFLNLVNLKGLPEFNQDITSVGIRYTGLYGNDTSIVYSIQSKAIDQIETIFISDDLVSQTNENGIAWLYGILTAERNSDYQQSYTSTINIHNVDEPVQVLIGTRRTNEHNLQDIMYLYGNNYVLIELKEDCTIDDINMVEGITYKSCPISASILAMTYSDFYNGLTTTPNDYTITSPIETTTEANTTTEPIPESTTFEPLDAKFDMELQLVNLPSKTRYILGESLDLTGLTVNLTLIGGDGERIPILESQPLSDLPDKYTYKIEGDTSEVGSPDITIAVSFLNEALNQAVTASDSFHIDVIHVMPMTSDTVTDNPTTETTTTTIAANYKNITQEDLENWAKNDYEYRSGNSAVSAETIINAAGNYEITLADENGTTLDVYTIDPATAEGTDQTGKEVNLPQTGYSDVYKIIVIFAVLMTVSGIALVLKTKKENE